MNHEVVLVDKAPKSLSGNNICVDDTQHEGEIVIMTSPSGCTLDADDVITIVGMLTTWLETGQLTQEGYE